MLRMLYLSAEAVDGYMGRGWCRDILKQLMDNFVEAVYSSKLRRQAALCEVIE